MTDAKHPGEFAPATGRVVRQGDAPLLSARDGEQTFRSTLNRITTGTEVISGGWYRVAAGVANHLDMHPDHDEFYFIHRGAATMMLAGEAVPMAAGDTVFVPHGVEHQIVNDTAEPLELFYVFAPASPPFPVRDPQRYPVVKFEPA